MKTIIILALLSFSSCAHTKTQAPVQAPVTPQPAVVQHPAASDANASKVSCTRGTDVRTLEVVKKSAGCSLQYEKFGKTSSVASSDEGQKHCQDSQAKIRGKLEKAGFSCK
jgi:hypothetical protein